MNKDRVVRKELMRIPGVGKRVAEDLLGLGIRSVSDLRGLHPEVLYERLCELQQARVDRCMLYVFRCAVYFAEHDGPGDAAPDAERLKWWNWKD